jgi:antirestriction protein ArdC
MAITTTDAIAMLEAGIEQLQSEQAWRDYLSTQARFHQYSFGNVLLMARQRPTATRVAGFHAWKDLGYSVRKGEKGIAILAPITVTRREETPEGEVEVRRLVNFRVVYVFDVAQVDAGPKAKPLGSFPGCERLQGEAPAELVDRLSSIASEIGYRVEFSASLEHPAANGQCDFSHQLITVRPDLGGAQTIKTFAHELAHAILHDSWTLQMSREQRELEAESTAFVVCQALGIDSSSYSFAYVTSWTGKDAAKLIRASGERIQKAAHRILTDPVAVDAEVAA